VLRRPACLFNPIQLASTSSLATAYVCASLYLPALPCPLLAEHYPYLLVNIGSGVSMVRVDGENKFQRVSGEHTCQSSGGGMRSEALPCVRVPAMLFGQ
jgi:hypothetical protein